MKDLAFLFAPLLVRASAGTGKTYELSTRYLALLCKGETPDHILATTFTKKAAGEIKERVFQHLAKAALDNNFASVRAKDMGLEGEFNSSRALKILKDLVRSQNRLNICTLDSLFFKMATSFSNELGMLPGWTCADDNTDNRVFSEAMRGMCVRQDPLELGRLMRLINKGAFRRSVHIKLKEEVSRAFDVFRQTDPEAWRWINPGKGVSDEELLQTESNILAIELPKTKEGKPNANWVKAVNADIERIRRRDWEAFVGGGIPKALSSDDRTYYKISISKEIQDVYRPAIRQATAHLLTVLKERSAALHELLQLFEIEYEKQRASTHSLGFNDIKTVLTRAALSENLSDMYYRLDCRFKHVLLDEFQDTSGSEWRVIKPIAHEILSKARGENSFFCVGDVKQAIYAWRGGRAEIFDGLKNTFPEVLKEETKDTSYRSARAIIDTVNKVFSSISENPALEKYSGAAHSWESDYLSHKTVRREVEGYASLIAVSSGKDDADPKAAIYRRTAELAKEIHEKAPSASVGILVRKNTTVSRLIFELNRPEFDLAASGEGGTPLTDSAVVCSVLSLLLLIDHPGDCIAAFHVGSSPLGNLVGLKNYKDQLELLKVVDNVRKRLESDGYGETITKLAEDLGPFCSERDYIRLKQLAELAFRYDKKTSLRAEEFVELVRATKVENPASGNIRIMTVHQAKGLEFDVIILPELDERLLRAPNSGVMCLYDNATQPPRFVSCLAAESIRALDLTLKEMDEQRIEIDLEEDLSVLYVALTRARDALYLFIPKPEKPSKKLSYAPILCHALTGEASPSKEGIIFETGEADWYRGFGEIEGEIEELESEVVEIKLPQAKDDERRMIPRKSPSSLEGGADVKSDSLFLSGSSSALERGSVIHWCFSKVKWCDVNDMDKGALWVEARRAFSGCLKLEEYIEEFVASLENQDIKRALSQKSYLGRSKKQTVFNELSFAFHHGESLLTGAIDRLVVGEDEGRATFAEVIDFKTDSIDINNPLSVRERVDYYRPQLSAYRLAASRLSGLPEKDISLKLIFTKGGKVVDL